MVLTTNYNIFETQLKLPKKIVLKQDKFKHIYATSVALMFA